MVLHVDFQEYILKEPFFRNHLLRLSEGGQKQEGVNHLSVGDFDAGGLTLNVFITSLYVEVGAKSQRGKNVKRSLKHSF